MTTHEPEESTFLYGYDIVVTRGPLRPVGPGIIEPHTARAALMCHEDTCGFPTRHDFLGRRQVSQRKSNLPLYDELVYSCSRCKAERVWGTEEMESLR